jgi:DNA-binding transcriptional MerR regulator
MRVKEVADLAGISVRTLHHYDEIGLLVPDGVTEAGYRIYSEQNLEMLQQILFFRELGFPLKRIKEIINDPKFDRLEALELHRKWLLEQRKRLDNMLGTLEKTIRHLKGEVEMSVNERFEGFDFSKNPYEEEARKRWGNEAVDGSNAKIRSLTPQETEALQEDMTAIYRKLADLRHTAPDSDEAQAAIGEWYNLLQRIGSYSPEAFRNLGQLYVDDERFTKSIDRFGEGLAAFMRDAMAVYADRLQAQ